jgi:hypothetical protein
VSANSLGELAYASDVKPPGTDLTPFYKPLVASIPSESLAGYTALISIILSADVGNGYGPFRWAAFGAFVLVAFLAPFGAFRQQVRTSTPRLSHRRFPLRECSVAALAAAAWGLAMPGTPLSITVKGTAYLFATTAIVIGGAAVLLLATQVLGTANTKNPRSGPGQPQDPSAIAPTGNAAQHSYTPPVGIPSVQSGIDQRTQSSALFTPAAAHF